MKKKETRFKSTVILFALVFYSILAHNAVTCDFCAYDGHQTSHNTDGMTGCSTCEIQKPQDPLESCNYMVSSHCTCTALNIDSLMPDYSTLKTISEIYILQPVGDLSNTNHSNISKINGFLYSSTSPIHPVTNTSGTTVLLI